MCFRSILIIFPDWNVIINCFYYNWLISSIEVKQNVWITELQKCTKNYISSKKYFRDFIKMWLGSFLSSDGESELQRSIQTIIIILSKEITRGTNRQKTGVEQAERSGVGSVFLFWTGNENESDEADHGNEMRLENQLHLTDNQKSFLSSTRPPAELREAVATSYHPSVLGSKTEARKRNKLRLLLSVVAVKIIKT